MKAKIFGLCEVRTYAAQQLISHQSLAVVAMQYNVRVDSTALFAEQFYRSLGRKNSLATAVSQAQEAMGAEGTVVSSGAVPAVAGS